MRRLIQILLIIVSTGIIYCPASFVEPSVPVSGESCGCGLRTGPPGKDGRDGKDGLSVQGPPGSPGQTGRDGKDGRDGLPGQSGSKGDTGDAGEPGEPGETGEPGLPGPKGTCDPSEVNALRAKISSLESKIASLKLEAESNSTAHQQKLKDIEKEFNNKLSTVDSRLTSRMLELLNIIKAVNASRIPGPRGPVGATGAQGIQGAKGDVGPKGDTGSTGPQGQPGPQGSQGIKGDQGLKGDKGESGISALTNCRRMKNETTNDAKPFPSYQLDATAKSTQGYVATGVTCSSSGGTSTLSILNDGTYKCICSGHTTTSGGRVPPSTLGVQYTRPRPTRPNPWKNLTCTVFYWECPVGPVV